jgi:ADP-heptose:LPS heptosyltransferase
MRLLQAATIHYAFKIAKSVKRLKALRILTINFGGIGDEILFLPTLESIRKAYPDAHLSLLLEPRSKSFQQVTDLVDEILEFDIKKKPLRPSDLWAVLQLIKAGKFDLVLSSGSSPPVAALLFLSGIKKRIGYGSNPLAKMLLTTPVPLDRNQYAAAMYQDLASGIGATKTPASDCLPRAILKPDSIARMTEFLTRASATAPGGSNGNEQRRNQRRIIIHPGTSRLAVEKGIIKTWATEHWVSLISKMQATPDLVVILAGGPDDEAIIKEINAQVKTAPNLISAVGQTKSLADLGALIDLCDMLVCVDSAPMHLAVALNKPVVALFGPTDESKLLPPNKLFKALRDRPTSELPRQLGDGLGVLLQPDTVFQSVLDQLKELTVQESSRAQIH